MRDWVKWNWEDIGFVVIVIASGWYAYRSEFPTAHAQKPLKVYDVSKFGEAQKPAEQPSQRGDMKLEEYNGTVTFRDIVWACFKDGKQVPCESDHLSKWIEQHCVAVAPETMVDLHKTLKLRCRPDATEKK
jgi:hypothetical protein